MQESTDSHPAPRPGLTRFLPPMPLFLLQPILKRVVARVARENPSLFNRLGPHKTARFVVDPQGLPFGLLLIPDPEALTFRAFHRNAEPPSDARIAGKFLDLLGLMDGGADGDALFFSRDLDVTGNTEAVVCLRNALDDVEGSIAETVAGMFGAPGRAALAGLRRMAAKKGDHA
ncbi:SCP2 domain-containing protein [Phaeovulum sp.]|uniref:ubiquinone anaerobic biosynthesis accessory factor UbiT n=1 Tax=Phaeovulum sp. TaxID=2934796 RepID=UPI0035656AB1